jgi:hypothetical protein
MLVTFEVVQDNLLGLNFELKMKDDKFVIKELDVGFEWTFNTLEESDAFYHGASYRVDEQLKKESHEALD